MGSGKSPVWRTFDRVERAIGKPLEDAVASSRYVDAMTQGLKVQRKVGGAVGGVAGGLVNRVLRIANLPTRGDVRDLNRQIAVLTREVRDLAAVQQRQSLEAAATKPTPTSRSARRTDAS